MLIQISSAESEKALIPLDKLPLLFETIPIESLAVASQFMRRQPKKITPRALLFAFLQSVISEGRSLRNIAMATGFQSGCTISKQAIDYRINDEFVDFLERVLAALLVQRSGFTTEWADASDLFRAFTRVLVQDSTTLPLHSQLVSDFPGPTNQHGQSATAKIQIVLDLLQERLCHFELGAFTENDQSKAFDILQIAQPGDLIIRDLGYFVLAALQQLNEKGIFFLSRLRHETAIFKRGSNERIMLLELLTQYGFLDIYVDVGAKERVPLRLVAQPVSREVYAQRLKKAQNPKDKRLSHSKEYLALLAWNIYITNVPPQIWTAQQACQVNQVRWRIEIVIKTWKSHFSIHAVPKGNTARVKAHIYAALIFITLFQNYFYVLLANFAGQHQKGDISLLKLAQFVKEYKFLLAIMPYNQNLQNLIIKQILYHCKYEHRKRLSYPQKFRTLS